MSKKLISIIIPAYNEEECVDELARRLQKVCELETTYDFQIVQLCCFIATVLFDLSLDL